MTPLAHSFAKELTIPVAKRKINDMARLMDKLGSTHSFDCTAISDAIEDAIDSDDSRDVIRNLLEDVIMPSEITWLEFGPVELRAEGTGDSWKAKLAIVVEKQDDWFKFDFVLQDAERGNRHLFSMPLGKVKPGTALSPRGFDYQQTELMGMAWTDGIDTYSMTDRFVAMATLALDIIGQPTLCHLKVHQPHRGLEKALLRGGVGKYPLLAWHEVLIKPQDRPMTPEEIEGHLTGRKCLHFVRGHRRRYRDGRETKVTHHWRGDPALGIQQTRYRVESRKGNRP